MNLTKFTLLLFLFSTIFSFGQQTVSNTELSELKKQNTELKAENEKLKNQFSKLKEEIKYYKETLDAFNSEIEKTDKNVHFKVTSVNGSINTGTIYLEGIVTNKGVLRTLQGKTSMIYDPKGNAIRVYKMTVGGIARIEKFYKDVPTKFTLKIRGIVSGTPMLKSVNMEYFSRIGYKDDNLNIVFNNLKVKWENKMY